MKTPTTSRLITSTIHSGVRAGLHKGDLQDAVFAALKRRLTIDESILASRVLEATGYDAPCGFRPRDDAAKAA